MSKTILAVGAHIGDMELTCGALLAANAVHSPFGAPPSKGRREKERRICAANENTRAPLRAPQSLPSKKRRIQS